MVNNRTHGRCVKCKKRFRLDEQYVVYSGLVFCSKKHLFEWWENHNDTSLSSEFWNVVRDFEYRNIKNNEMFKL